jgi:hypothetical protein
MIAEGLGQDVEARCIVNLELILALTYVHLE